MCIYALLIIINGGDFGSIDIILFVLIGVHGGEEYN